MPKIECPPRAKHRNTLRKRLRSDIYLLLPIAADATRRAELLALLENHCYVSEGLASWGRARRENRQRQKRKRNVYARNNEEGNAEDNSEKEPKRN
jgi:hypothetical protein